MYQHTTQIRVRYAETDQMGYVYYGNYAMYYEVARVESLRNLGLIYKALEADGIIMPVAENKTKYIRPARYDDLLTIQLFVKEMPDRRITFEYEIYNEQKKLLNLGETILAFVDMKTGKSIQAPDTIVKALKPFFDGQ
ncbi:MAG TPA: thioesterase [Cytophagales bacterium]|jgi:acyl-CoA thioester hydrolase|nr:thioesterase [Cytophagales bacterium]